MIRKAYVTGATGVVGSALVRELLENGYRVAVFLREGSPHNDRLDGHPNLEKIVCPLEELFAFGVSSAPECPGMPEDPKLSGGAAPEPGSALPEQGSARNTGGVFFHLGWSGTKGKERNDPRIHTENIRYALDAVSLAKRLGCDLFIGAGSQAECGRQSGRLAPDTVPRPENAYGAGKLAAGHMTRIFAHQLGMRQIWTRILSVYGPNDGERTLVTSCIRAFLSGRSPECTAGEQIWDFLSWIDAARALRLIAERGQDGKTYLIASGRERTLRSYIGEIRDTLSPGTPISFGAVPYAPGQVMHLSADISETVRDTGWKPSVSFRDGILMTAEAERRAGRFSHGGASV